MPAEASRARILILLTLSDVGGTQTYVASLVPGLLPRYDVIVAAGGRGPLATAVEQAGARYVEIPHLDRDVRPLQDARAFGELVRLMRRERPLVVHTNNAKTGALGRLAATIAGVPARILAVHTWPFAAADRLTARGYLVIDRALRRLTTHTICVCEEDRRLGVEHRTCDLARSSVIHNGVAVGEAPVAAHEARIPTIVSVGRLQAPQKDFLTLIRALALLPRDSFHAVIIGEGPDRAMLDQEVRGLGLARTVELAGERGDVPQLLAAADVFTLATTYESLPLSIIEAMAAALPVVASSVGGIPELVVDGETGLLVPPRDARALADALQRLLADPGLRARMGRASRARAEARFDLQPFREAHLALYDRLSARAGSRSRSGSRSDAVSPARAAP